MREVHELMLVVERLSMQDQRRIVRLINLLRQAPDTLREQTQERLKDLIARETQTHTECLASIDKIMASAERELENQLYVVQRDEGSASDLKFGRLRKSG